MFGLKIPSQVAKITKVPPADVSRKRKATTSTTTIDKDDQKSTKKVKSTTTNIMDTLKYCPRHNKGNKDPYTAHDGYPYQKTQPSKKHPNVKLYVCDRWMHPLATGQFLTRSQLRKVVEDIQPNLTEEVDDSGKSVWKSSAGDIVYLNKKCPGKLAVTTSLLGVATATIRTQHCCDIFLSKANDLPSSSSLPLWNLLMPPKHSLPTENAEMMEYITNLQIPTRIHYEQDHQLHQFLQNHILYIQQAHPHLAFVTSRIVGCNGANKPLMSTPTEGNLESLTTLIALSNLSVHLQDQDGVATQHPVCVNSIFSFPTSVPYGYMFNDVVGNKLCIILVFSTAEPTIPPEDTTGKV
jgi:hypothetical protein